MSSAANSTTRASLGSLWLLRTHCTKRFGSHPWLINLETFPKEPASMQYSGSFSINSSPFSDKLFIGNGTLPNRL